MTEQANLGGQKRAAVAAAAAAVAAAAATDALIADAGGAVERVAAVVRAAAAAARQEEGGEGAWPHRCALPLLAALPPPPPPPPPPPSPTLSCVCVSLSIQTHPGRLQDFKGRKFNAVLHRNAGLVVVLYLHPTDIVPVLMSAGRSCCPSPRHRTGCRVVP